MSARECQNHEWMKKEVTRPTPRADVVPSVPTTAPTPTPAPPAPAPTTPAPTTSVSTNPVSTTPTVVIPTSVSIAPPATNTITPATPTPTPAAPTPIPTPAPASTTPKPITPAPSVATTPALPEINTPTVDIGRPPLHPLTPVKQFAPPFPEPLSGFSSPITAVPHALLQRSESRSLSRHNLDRIRSMSKSREVLSERIQMSNLKKTMSKSRERLFDARLGVSKSRERLMGLRSFSQSVEALSALSQLNQENAVYQSCNNIFVPMITPTTKEADVCRMYKSLAAIDQIDEFDCTHKLGYFESRLSKDDEDYNDIVTRHNTSLNSVIAVQDSKPVGSNYMVNEARLRGGGRGGRSTDICDKRCPRHNHRQPEAQPTQKIPKVNRAERMKREAQRRRKEKKEREREEKERQKAQAIEHAEAITRNNKTTHEKSGESSNSPGGRRRSSSHVEQRLAERHERQQERLEKQERKNSVIHRKREPSDSHDKSPVTERVRPGKTSSGLEVPQERPRSTTPTRKNRTKKTSNAGSDVSQASSLESVDGNLESPRSPARPKRPTSLELPEIKIFPEAISPASFTGDVNDNVLKEDSGREIDEAYISLEDPALSRSHSTPSTSHAETTTPTTTTDAKHEEPKQEQPKPRRKFAELLDNPLFVRQAEISNQSCVQNTPDAETSEDPEKEKTLKVESERSTFGSCCELTIIKEEERQAPKKTASSYVRSISTTSDLGSMVSASSECSLEREEGGGRSPATDVDSFEWKSRGRAISFLNNPSSPRPRVLSRSNSMHLDSPVNPARPWGNLCDGAVARALEKFKKPEDQAATKKTRRQSSPVMSPSSSPRLH